MEKDNSVDRRIEADVALMEQKIISDKQETARRNIELLLKVFSHNQYFKDSEGSVDFLTLATGKLKEQINLIK